MWREVPTLNAPDKIAPRRPAVPWHCYWLGTVALIGVVHSPSAVVQGVVARLLAWLAGTAPAAQVALAEDLNADYVVPLREVAFYVGLLVLLVAVVREVRAQGALVSRAVWRGWARDAALAFAVLAVLASPIHHPLMEVGMGVVYADYSSHPFDIPMSWEYRRLLKPALAHLLQLDRPLTYLLFSLALTGGLLVAVRGLLAFAPARADDGTTRTTPPVPWLGYLSLCTSSMVFFDFGSPGWTDQLVFLLLLAGWCWPLGDQSRLAVVTLALVTHEAALTLLVPLVWLRYPRRLWWPAGGLVAAYFGAMWLSQGGSYMPVVHAHDMSRVWSAWLREPVQILCGIAMGYKLLWLIPPLVIALEGRRRPWAEHLWPAVWLLLPLTLTLVAWDYSRLAAWGFIGLAVYLTRLWAVVQSRPGMRTAVATLFVLNLLIPSANTYTAVASSPGFYAWLLHLLTALVGGGA